MKAIIILKEFLEYLSSKNYSKATIKGYEMDVTIFLKFLVQFMNLEIKINDISIFILRQVEQKEIIAFLVYLNYTRNNGSATRKRKMMAIRHFFKWLSIKYDIKNPTEDYWIERTEIIPKYLNLEQAKKIQNIFNKSNSRYYTRNNLIISLFLTTGIRVSELVNINIENINYEDGYILIIGKGNRDRKVFLNKGIKEKLLEYENNTGALFLSKNGERLSISSVQNICKKAFNLLGVGDNGYSAHTLRHTSASILYKHTKDILIVREFLGHKSVSSTQIYTHIDQDLIRNAVNKNPLNTE